MNETIEEIERRLRYFFDSDDLEFYVGFHLHHLSIDFIREVQNKVDLFAILTRKFIDFNKGLQEEEQIGWEQFIIFYFKNCREFLEC